MEDPISYDVHGVSVLTTLDLPSDLIKDAMAARPMRAPRCGSSATASAHIKVMGIPVSLLGTVPDGLVAPSCTTDNLPETLQHKAAHSADAFTRLVSPMAVVSATIGVANGVAVEFMQTGC